MGVRIGPVRAGSRTVRQLVEPGASRTYNLDGTLSNCAGSPGLAIF